VEGRRARPVDRDSPKSRRCEFPRRPSGRAPRGNGPPGRAESGCRRSPRATARVCPRSPTCRGSADRPPRAGRPARRQFDEAPRRSDRGPARRASRARAARRSERSAGWCRSPRDCVRRAESRRSCRPRCKCGSRTGRRARARAGAASGSRPQAPAQHPGARARLPEASLGRASAVVCAGLPPGRASALLHAALPPRRSPMSSSFTPRINQVSTVHSTVCVCRTHPAHARPRLKASTKLTTGLGGCSGRLPPRLGTGSPRHAEPSHNAHCVTLEPGRRYNMSCRAAG